MERPEYDTKRKWCMDKKIKYLTLSIGLFLIPNFCFVEGKDGLEFIFRLAAIVIVLIIALFSFFILKAISLFLKKSWSIQKMIVISIIIGVAFLLILSMISYPEVNWFGI